MGFSPDKIGNRFDHTGEKETNNDRYICIKAHEHLRGSFSPTVKGKLVPKRRKEGMMKNRMYDEGDIWVDRGKINGDLGCH